MHKCVLEGKLACFTNVDFSLVGLGLSRSILGLAGSSLSQIGLMALPLCVCQVVSLVIVKCQTQLTLVTTTSTTTRSSKATPSLIK